MNSSDNNKAQAHMQVQHNAESANNIAANFDCLQMNKKTPTSGEPKGIDRVRNDDSVSFLKGYN